jgi:hypothetical protein
MMKKYGKKNVKTHWVSDWYTDPYEIQKIALHFSYENEIDKSEKWANLKPENGLDGGSTSDIQSKPEVTAKKLATWAKNGTTFKGEQNPMFGISVGDGKDNPCYNHTLYDFYNIVTHERISATQHDLHLKFGLSRSSICGVANGDRLTVKNWRLYKNKDTVVDNGNKDNTIYHLTHSDTGEVFRGTKSEFERLYKCGMPNPKLKKKILSSKGWKITGDERMNLREGKNNKRYDHTVYQFCHIETGKIVASTQNEFKKNFLPNNNNIPGLVSGKPKTIGGWRIL